MNQTLTAPNMLADCPSSRNSLVKKNFHNCKPQISTGRPVPREYYAAGKHFESEGKESEEKEPERVKIGAWWNNTHSASYQVDRPGSKLKWEILSVDYDIAYGWSLEDGENPPQEIVSYMHSFFSTIELYTDTRPL